MIIAFASSFMILRFLYGMRYMFLNDNIKKNILFQINAINSFSEGDVI